MDFAGLTTVNIELTSRCNKTCGMCGRRKIERDFPELVDWGDMDFGLVEKIASELPDRIVVQFHNNGEGLLFPRFGEATQLFKKQYRCITTNGKLLIEKADEIMGNLHSVAVSIFRHDREASEQYSIVREFVKLKGRRRPIMIWRCLDEVNFKIWEQLPGIIVKRVLHEAMGSRGYQKEVTKPEIGVCLDLLNHMSIDRYGNVSTCVRFDPHKQAVIGNVNEQSLAEIWDGKERKQILKKHWAGKRNELSFCAACDFWGVPTG